MRTNEVLTPTITTASPPVLVPAATSDVELDRNFDREERVARDPWDEYWDAYRASKRRTTPTWPHRYLGLKN